MSRASRIGRALGAAVAGPLAVTVMLRSVGWLFGLVPVDSAWRDPAAFGMVMFAVVFIALTLILMAVFTAGELR